MHSRKILKKKIAEILKVAETREIENQSPENPLIRVLSPLKIEEVVERARVRAVARPRKMAELANQRLPRMMIFLKVKAKGKQYVACNEPVADLWSNTLPQLLPYLADFW